jgi:hypothetical protein
LFW